MPTIKVELSSKNIAKIKDYFNNVNAILSSRELLVYLQGKIEEVLTDITNRNLRTDDIDDRVHKYRLNHKVEIVGNKIQVYNKTLINQEDIISGDIANYPNGFNVSKAVEYGTGQLGAGSEASQIANENGWLYMQNPEKDYGKAWAYQISREKNAQTFWSRGMSGKLIFYKTKQEVIEKAPSWIREYVNKKLGGEFK